MLCELCKATDGSFRLVLGEWVLEEHQCIRNASGLHCQSERAVEARSEMVELLQEADDLCTHTSNVRLPG